MALSSVCVVLSSLALNMYSPPGEPSNWGCSGWRLCAPRQYGTLHSGKQRQPRPPSDASGIEGTAPTDALLPAIHSSHVRTCGYGTAEQAGDEPQSDEEEEEEVQHSTMFEGVCTCECDSCRSNKHFTATGSSLKLPADVEASFTGTQRQSCGCQTCECG
jgi:hypothetical protein